MMKQIANGNFKYNVNEGDEVYSIRENGTFKKYNVAIVEDRGFYNRLHLNKIMKNGKIGKKVVTASEDELYTYVY